jgi:hypothetical protein
MNANGIVSAVGAVSSLVNTASQVVDRAIAQ